ncbi:MAG: glucose-6-phosphate dehydrogenase [Armatimonadota bacterium]
MPEKIIRPESSVIVIFGAGGDLTWRKLVPALYNLFLDKWMPDQFTIIGIDLKPMKIDDFRDRLLDGVNRFSRQGKVDLVIWKEFASHITEYISADFNDSIIYINLSKKLTAQDKKWNVKANRIFYMATPPSVIGLIARHLGSARLSQDRERSRMVAEKPFGRNLETAHALNNDLTSVFHESQICRIDHYLGKETVQNILAFRFANSLFEPIWDRRYVDHIQITVAERLGVEHRGGYYEHAGAIRDMVQNHLIQVLCFVAMEPPVSFDADEIRNKKLDVLQAVQPIPQDQVNQYAVRGQYGAGQIDGQDVVAYRQEPAVSIESQAETFAAIKLYVDNWRWEGVPFYLRTGKRLPSTVSEVAIKFKEAPHHPFPDAAVKDQWERNSIIIRIEPDEGIQLQFQAKHPGMQMRLVPVEMNFSYQKAFNTSPPEAYETLLLDIMLGDATLFMRADQVEKAWSIVQPILNAWEANPIDFPNYAAGSWGPDAAEDLITKESREWLKPASLCCRL